jgi:hypothetical protein
VAKPHAGGDTVARLTETFVVENTSRRNEIKTGVLCRTNMERVEKQCVSATTVKYSCVWTSVLVS